MQKNQYPKSHQKIQQKKFVFFQAIIPIFVTISVIFFCLVINHILAEVQECFGIGYVTITIPVLPCLSFSLGCFR